MVKKKFFNFFFILTIFFIDRLSKFLIIEYSQKLGDDNLLTSLGSRYRRSALTGI